MRNYDARRHAIYLSGAIEYAADANSWRNKMYKELSNFYDVIIPNSNCPYEKTDKEYRSYIKQNFIVPDMISVTISEYFFVKLDPGVFKGAGTISELTTACWMGKHIAYFLDGIKEEEIPGWTLGCLHNAQQVISIDSAIEMYKRFITYI